MPVKPLCERGISGREAVNRSSTAWTAAAEASGSGFLDRLWFERIERKPPLSKESGRAIRRETFPSIYYYHSMGIKPDQHIKFCQRESLCAPIFPLRPGPKRIYTCSEN